MGNSEVCFHRRNLSNIDEDIVEEAIGKFRRDRDLMKILVRQPRLMPLEFNSLYLRRKIKSRG